MLIKNFKSVGNFFNVDAFEANKNTLVVVNLNFGGIFRCINGWTH